MIQLRKGVYLGMKKGKMIALMVGAIIVVVAVITLIIVSIPAPTVNYSAKSREDIVALADDVVIQNYDPDELIPANSDNGQTADRIMGDENAPITIFTYADYACSACASWSEVLNEKLSGDWKGKVRVVYREFLRVEQSVKPTAAAWAAAEQGYWQQYHDKLFEKQSEWASLSGSAMQKQLEKYMTDISDGKVNMNKFREDMKSERVAKYAAFTYKMAQYLDLTGTPMFRMDGKQVEISNLIETVEQKIATLK